MSAPAAIATAFRERPTDALFGDAVSLASDGILRARIKDLKLHLAGTLLERQIQQLYAELEAKGISLRPQCYLSDQWGCPSGVPVIGIPFYLADAKLLSIEAALGDGAETEREIMMYLRHEAGHCINYAYRLYDSEEWRRLFGDYTKPYRDEYKPRPFSRKYVVHISGWYAQKHPDEDFAETFAVWLTPGSDWQNRYRSWGALKKLQYVEATMTSVGRATPPVTLAEPDLEVDQMEETVLDHYRARNLAERVDLQLGDQLDQDLCNLFEAPEPSSARADNLVRAERETLLQAVTQYSGVSRSLARSVLEHLQERIALLNLTVRREQTHTYVTRLAALLTALTMNHLYTDRFFDAE